MEHSLSEVHITKGILILYQKTVLGVPTATAVDCGHVQVASKLRLSEWLGSPIKSGSHVTTVGRFFATSLNSRLFDFRCSIEGYARFYTYGDQCGSLSDIESFATYHILFQFRSGIRAGHSIAWQWSIWISIDGNGNCHIFHTENPG